MPYAFNWYDAEHTIIHMHIYGDASWETWHDVVDKICTVLRATSKRVNLIIVDDVGMPRGDALAHMKITMMKLKAHKNFGSVYIVANASIPAAVKAMTKLLAKAVQAENAYFVDFVEEAMNLIQKDYQTV